METMKYKDYENMMQSILFKEEDIKNMVERIGSEVTAFYQRKGLSKNGKLLAIAVLKGAVVFFADLIRAIKVPVEVSFITASSYGKATTSDGEVAVKMTLDPAMCAGADIMVVEDILDTGHTLSRVIAAFEEMGARSVTLCTLLDKPARRKVPIKADFIGAEIPDAFVVGYGLDYAEDYRQLPYIGILKPEAYSK
jgi:hypoxanthine phosphoribosyltransferase